MKRLPLIDLQAQYRAIKPDIDRAIGDVLARGQFVLGPEGEALEQELARYCGVRHAAAVASGTDALELALRACGVGPGHEVITTAYSFIATAEAIVAAGAVPVFADIDPRTCNLDPARIEPLVTKRTKAVIPVHLYGHPCEMRAIGRIARRRRLAVVEDCAQAIGARAGGRPVGSFGDAAALSFYPSKNLGAYGDGGMVVTNSARIASQVRLLRVHGGRVRYRHEALGMNSRLDELQAALLRVKLRRLDRWTAARRQAARRYAAAFRAAGLAGRIRLPVERAGCQHVYHLYTVRVNGRDRIQRALAGQGIDTQVAYPGSLPDQPALAAYRRLSPPCPEARRASREVLSLPMFPELSSASIRRIVTAISRLAPASKTT